MDNETHNKFAKAVELIKAYTKAFADGEESPKIPAGFPKKEELRRYAEAVGRFRYADINKHEDAERIGSTLFALHEDAVRAGVSHFYIAAADDGGAAQQR